MKSNIIKTKSFDFALRIVKLYQYLTDSKNEYVLSKQLLRSGTAIGALVRESEHAESKADFIHKMKIAAKEADESKYWFEICNRAKTYPNPDVNLSNQLDVITKIISKIIGTSKRNLK